MKCTYKECRNRNNERIKSDKILVRFGKTFAYDEMVQTRNFEFNAKLSRFMIETILAHMKLMKQVVKYVASTLVCGLLLKPNVKWDGNPEFEFEILGKSDLDYAKDRATRTASVFMQHF